MPGEVFRCSWVDEDENECGKTFGSRQSFSSHQNSHKTRPCRRCWREIKVNGHTQHEEACDVKPEGIPWDVLRSQIEDLLHHSSADVGDTAVCFVTPDVGAAFMSPAAALRRVVEHLGQPMMVIPARLLPDPDEVGRWRRVSAQDRTGHSAVQELNPEEPEIDPLFRTPKKKPPGGLLGVDLDPII